MIVLDVYRCGLPHLVDRLDDLGELSRDVTEAASRLADATVAFGENLLGAILGGCLEYLSLIIGYEGLLVVVDLLYLGAFALLPRTARAL
ncbi:hypothetical protein AB0M95_27045 [Sphaerisporangium sp. NPDC051017]|uniref:hypothetical protein n=1 Tax=Sphaerisporangium sp. NPDC051017 TaxID=3154636 RepID=UPI00344A9276